MTAAAAAANPPPAVGDWQRYSSSSSSTSSSKRGTGSSCTLLLLRFAALWSAGRKGGQARFGYWNWPQVVAWKRVNSLLTQADNATVAHALRMLSMCCSHNSVCCQLGKQKLCGWTMGQPHSHCCVLCVFDGTIGTVAKEGLVVRVVAGGAGLTKAAHAGWGACCQRGCPHPTLHGCGPAQRCCSRYAVSTSAALSGRIGSEPSELLWVLQPSCGPFRAWLWTQST
jgi:hypothetical protein